MRKGNADRLSSDALRRIVKEEGLPNLHFEFEPLLGEEKDDLERTNDFSSVGQGTQLLAPMFGADATTSWEHHDNVAMFNSYVNIGRVVHYGFEDDQDNVLKNPRDTVLSFEVLLKF